MKLEKAMMFIIIAITLIIPAMALEFDNVKSYDSATKTATISNSFGLGEDIATAQLITGKRMLVVTGEDKLVGVIDIVLNEDYTNAISMDSYNTKNLNVKVSRDFKYKQGIVTQNTYKIQTKICSNEDCSDYRYEIKDEIRNDIEWKDVDINNLKAGSYKIGLFTNVNEGDDIEWIPTLFGVKIEEWASFVGASLYEHLDYGVISTGWNPVAYTYAQSFNVGYNSTNVSQTLKGVSLLVYQVGSGSPACSLNLTGVNASGAPNATQLSYNGSIDMTAVTLNTNGEWFNITMPDVTLAQGGKYGLRFKCNVTNAILWNENDTNIYSGGEAYRGDGTPTGWVACAGGSCEYPLGDFFFKVYSISSTATTMVTTLISPNTGTITNISNILFNATYSTTGNATNGTLFINGVRNSSNTITGANGSLIFNRTFANGNYNWTYLFCNSNNTCGYAVSNRTLIIDSAAPTITLVSPTSLIAYGSLGRNITINYTISDINIDTCRLEYNGTKNINCGTNSSISLNRQKNLTIYANDTAGNLNTNYLAWEYSNYNCNLFQTSGCVAYYTFGGLSPTCYPTYGSITANNTYTGGSSTMENMTCRLEGYAPQNWAYNISDGDKSFSMGSMVFLNLTFSAPTNITITSTDEGYTFIANESVYINQSDIGLGQVLVSFGNSQVYSYNNDRQTAIYKHLNVITTNSVQKIKVASSGLGIEGVLVEVYKQIDGSNQLVYSAFTDGNGIAMVTIKDGEVYTFKTYKTGYIDLTEVRSVPTGNSEIILLNVVKESSGVGATSFTTNCKAKLSESKDCYFLAKTRVNATNITIKVNLNGTITNKICSGIICQTEDYTISNISYPINATLYINGVLIEPIIKITFEDINARNIQIKFPTATIRTSSTYLIIFYFMVLIMGLFISFSIEKKIAGWGIMTFIVWMTIIAVQGFYEFWLVIIPLVVIQIFKFYYLYMK